MRSVLNQLDEFYGNGLTTGRRHESRRRRTPRPSRGGVSRGVAGSAAAAVVCVGALRPYPIAAWLLSPDRAGGDDAGGARRGPSRSPVAGRRRRRGGGRRRGAGAAEYAQARRPQADARPGRGRGGLVPRRQRRRRCQAEHRLALLRDAQRERDRRARRRWSRRGGARRGPALPRDAGLAAWQGQRQHQQKQQQPQQRRPPGGGGNRDGLRSRGRARPETRTCSHSRTRRRWTPNTRPYFPVRRTSWRGSSRTGHSTGTSSPPRQPRGERREGSRGGAQRDVGGVAVVAVAEAGTPELRRASQLAGAGGGGGRRCGT